MIFFKIVSQIYVLFPITPACSHNCDTKNQYDRYTGTSDSPLQCCGTSPVNGPWSAQEGKWCKAEHGWAVCRDLQNLPSFCLRESCAICLSEVWLGSCWSKCIPVPKALVLPQACFHAFFSSESHEKFRGNQEHGLFLYIEDKSLDSASSFARGYCGLVCILGSRPSLSWRFSIN